MKIHLRCSSRLLETSNQQVFITRYAYRLAEIPTILPDDDPRAYWNFYQCAVTFTQYLPHFHGILSDGEWPETIQTEPAGPSPSDKRVRKKKSYLSRVS
jgi:hypothetical protein